MQIDSSSSLFSSHSRLLVHSLNGHYICPSVVHFVAIFLLVHLLAHHIGKCLLSHHFVHYLGNLLSHLLNQPTLGRSETHCHLNSFKITESNKRSLEQSSIARINGM